MAPSQLSLPASSIRFPIQAQGERQWDGDLHKVKRLYLDRKYRQCAALCESMIKHDGREQHPGHITFLHFFSAICYESLGLASHKYSSNRLPLLNLAQDAFLAATQSLPLPSNTDKSASYISPGPSPAISDFSFTADTSSSRSSVATFTGPPVHATIIQSSRRSSISSGKYSQEDAGQDPSNDDTPEMNKYSLRHPLSTTLGNGLDDNNRDDGFDSRFDYMICGNNGDDVDLVPRPLFVKRKMDAVKDAVASAEISRAFSPIPTTLNLSNRKTAPSPLVKSASKAHLVPLCLLSPATACRLSSVQDKTPQTHRASSPHLSSRSVAHYNGLLASFRNRISGHIANVEKAMAQTTLLQEEHRAKHSKRLASFWSFDPAATNDEDGRESKAQEKRERIEKLKKDGWRVTKEKFGWKGEAYYDELRRKAEVELDAGNVCSGID